MVLERKNLLGTVLRIADQQENYWNKSIHIPIPLRSHTTKCLFNIDG